MVFRSTICSCIASAQKINSLSLIAIVLGNNLLFCFSSLTQISPPLCLRLWTTWFRTVQLMSVGLSTRWVVIQLRRRRRRCFVACSYCLTFHSHHHFTIKYINTVRRDSFCFTRAVERVNANALSVSKFWPEFYPSDLSQLKIACISCCALLLRKEWNMCNLASITQTQLRDARIQAFKRAWIPDLRLLPSAKTAS